MNSKQVVFFFRKPKPHYHSIERVFNLIIDNLPEEISTRKYFLTEGDHGILSRLKALKEVRKQKGFINHITGDISFVALGLPKKGLIVTFHDLESLERGNKLKTIFLKWIWVVLPARRAQNVTVISEHTKKKVMEWAGIKEEKISVIPNPIPKGFVYTPKEFNAECPTILAMGTKPNKNLEGTIEAIKNIRCKLIIAGHLHPNQVELLTRYLIDYDNLVGATDQQIIEVYKQCDLLCFPSFYEGFGMPIIEAQAVGRAVVTSNLGAMPETAGFNGALMVEPFSPTQIREGIKMLIENEALRNGIIEEGLRNASKFDLNQVKHKYLMLYQV